jgi:hypothetical protein
MDVLNQFKFNFHHIPLKLFQKLESLMLRVQKFKKNQLNSHNNLNHNIKKRKLVCFQLDSHYLKMVLVNIILSPIDTLDFHVVVKLILVVN